MNITFYLTDETPDFSPYRAPDDRHNGLVCVTQNIEVKHILSAYSHGAFPWYEDEHGHVYWFTQNPRAVLLPENLVVRKSLQKLLRNKIYRITVNHCFEKVIAQCAQIARAKQDGSWISERFQAAYYALHTMGYAHSFECWLPENGDWVLAGGLYGVQIGSVFYGESMFSQVPNASKMAFATAVPFLQRCGIRLIDCQQDTPHLATFGAQTLPLTEFKRQLAQFNAIPLTQTIAPQIIWENPPSKHNQ